MAWLILAAIIALPVVEIALFVQSADWIGVWPTVAVALLAVTGGSALLRTQGLSVLWRAQTQLARGEFPLDEAFDGLCLAAAGFLLVLPGFLTDALALLLLLPPVRRGLRAWVGRRFAVHTGRPATPGVIDGEYKVVDAQARVAAPDDPC